MNLAERYAVLVGPPAREESLLHVPRKTSEHEVQAHWFAGNFGRDFTTLDGRSVRIVQFGVWNREAGPDFADAAVSFDGGEPLHGPIELDMDVRDWERHGHSGNSNYERVILHIFTQRPGSECFTRTAEHRMVPQVLIDIGQLTDDALDSQPDAKPGRCCAPLSSFDEDRARAVLLGAAEHRLRRKAAALARLSEIHGVDEALFQALATTLGYKSNKLPFNLLAQRLPLRLLRSAKEEAGALIFGVSGFLPGRDFAEFDASTRGYLRTLWEHWWSRRGEYERIQIPSDFWTLSGQRPINHPQRRLAALAQMVHHWTKIRSLRQRCDPVSISDFFGTLSDDYWDFHYTISSKPAPRRMALVGENRVTDMLANVFFPLAYAEDSSRWLGFKNLPATLSNRRVEVAALRLFGPNSARSQEFLRSAALQQGLLQVYEDFCLRDSSDCANCRFPTQLDRW